MEITNQRYSIKQLSEILKIPTGTIRQWEYNFKNVISVPRDENNYRYYTDYEIEIFRHIKTFKEKGLRIHEIIDELRGKFPQKIEKNNPSWSISMQPPDDFWDLIREIVREEIYLFFSSRIKI